MCVNVPFQEQHYPALISVREDGQDMICLVRYVDKRVPYLLPGDTLTINPAEGVTSPRHLPPQVADALVACTCGAAPRCEGIPR